MHPRPLLRCAPLAAVLLVGCGEPPPAPPDVAGLPPLPAAPAAHEAPRGAERPVREAVLALVGEVRGEIEPCGCPTLPYGGFTRRGRLLERLRAGTRPVFHLDAGELLLKGRATTKADDPDRRAALLLALSAEVGVDVWVPGPSDLLALGPEGLADLAAGRLDAPPAISATLESTDGQLLLPASRVIERGGLTIGVVGLSGEPQGRALADRVVGRPAGPAARAAIAALPPEVDLVVGLGSLSDLDADTLAAEAPQLDLLLTTRGDAVDAPRRPTADGPLIIESPDRGRYLELVELRLASDRSQPLVQQPPAADWRSLETARAQVAHARATGGQRLEAREAALAQLEGRFDDVGRGRNLLRVGSHPLGEDLDPPEDRSAPAARPEAPTTLASRIAAFKEASIDQAARTAAQPLPPGVDAFASSGGCVNCHAQEFARWSFSDHAKAWMSLLRAQETGNPECVGCHSTAFGQPGGFGELTEANVRKWKAVQCEACHGPMATHLDDPRAGGHAVSEAGCRTCHDEANSPQFEFETYLRRASCQEPATPAPAP